MKRIQRGPVRGISLKLQEEERERRMDFVPEVSAIDIENIEVDKDTQAMLRALNLNINGVTVAEVRPRTHARTQHAHARRLCGLGLAVLRRVVSADGSHIVARSTPTERPPRLQQPPW